MKKNHNDDIDNLFDNNKEIMDKLMEEKRLLENIFLDNRTPEKFKQDLLASYNTLSEMIGKRLEVSKIIMESKEGLDIIGILYNETQERYIRRLIRNLRDISDRKKVSILCFTIDNLDIIRGLITGTLIDDSCVKESTVTIPKFIYNIGYFTKLYNRNKIKQLCNTFGSVVVNPVNIFSQAVVYDVLSSLPNSKDFILPFSTLSTSIIEKYLEHSDSIFLIPESGFIGNSAIRVERTGHPREKQFVVYSGKDRIYFDEDNPYQGIKKILGNKVYMVMQGRKALMWNDSPLEARVYIQKDITGRWNITHTVAKNEIFLKNSMYEDATEDLRSVLMDSIPDKADDIIENLTNCSKNSCVYLDYYFSQLGSCTLDFIIDKWGSPYIIFFGGWDQKDYLLKLNDKSCWDKYINNAINYLIYLKNTDERER